MLDQVLEESITESMQRQELRMALVEETNKWNESLKGHSRRRNKDYAHVANGLRINAREFGYSSMTDSEGQILPLYTL